MPEERGKPTPIASAGMLRQRIRNCLRWFTPFGMVEARRQQFRLSRLGISASQGDLAVLESAAQECRLELWPDWLRNPPHDWVLVDVGANHGEFTAAALRFVNPSMVIAVEPQPQCQASLQEIVKGRRNAQIFQLAVGDRSGSVCINRTGDDKMSSILEPTPAIEADYRAGDYRLRDKLEVHLALLDDLVPADARVGLLKLDVQGYELPVLRGAEAVLHRTSAILVEINFTQHYSGATSFSKLNRHLETAGFELFGVSAPFFGKKRPMWSDAVYVRK